MRPANNGRRSRGRSPRRQNQQPMRNTVYDSNGPETRVRGNASQICEKYTALARDAASASDYIKMEAFYQHAEHYQRILNTIAAEKEARDAQAAAAGEDGESEGRHNRGRNNRGRDNRGRDNRHNRNDRNDRYDNRRAATSDDEQSDETTLQVDGEAIEKVISEAVTAETTDIQPAPAAPAVVDLSEVEQPAINPEPVQSDVSVSTDAVEEEAPVKKRRAPAKPRTPRAPRAPRKPRVTKADSENGAVEEKAFGDAPLPGFLETDKID